MYASDINNWLRLVTHRIRDPYIFGTKQILQRKYGTTDLLFRTNWYLTYWSVKPYNI